MEQEFDLMAYVDGLLDDDPARKALVEERLRASPEDAARVEAYRAQNAALRRRYGWRVEESVPQRLYAVLERPAGASVRVALRVAAMVVLTAAAGLSGWWVGHSEGTDWPPPGLLEVAGAANGATAVRAGSAAPLNWLSDRISVSLRMPNLSARGYAVMGKETVHVADERLVRLIYGRSDGSGSFSLFLRPWWDSRNAEIELVRRDDAWLAYWRDGPLASIIASRLPREEVASLAREIRRAMNDSNRAAPRVQPGLPPSGLPGMATAPAPGAPQSPAAPLAPANDRMPNAGSVIQAN